MIYLTVDGMLSGTGIRNSVEGGYLKPDDLGLSVELKARIIKWLILYENAHYNQYQNQLAVEALDKEGVLICEVLKKEVPESKVEYFSNAEMRKIQM